jgi:hypothetical protein
MSIVDVRKLTRAEICKLGSNTAAQVESDRRLTRTTHERGGVLNAGKAPAASPITKRKEAIAC